MTTKSVEKIVIDARAGDLDAFAELVARFQDMAVGCALAQLGDAGLAEDAAQDAFLLAQERLAQLREPAAFPAWLRRVVVSCCERIRRADGKRPARHASEGTGSDPAEVVERRATAEAVRAAIESLPAHERIVVALFYLGGYSQQEVARFLEVPVSTVKKRSFDARKRLKRELEMVAKALDEARPSRTTRFSSTVLLFAAIRRGDLTALRRQLEREPRLANAKEDWSPDQARAASLHFAGGATALVRAAESGELEIVSALVDSGAAVDQRCSCDSAEAPLWAAVVAGRSAVVAYLLDRGADPNLAAAHGVTPLHAAVIRGSEELARMLLEAGADPSARDNGARSPNDWAELHGSQELLTLLDARVEVARPEPDRGKQGRPQATSPETGIKALDLFAPLGRGELVYWHGSYGLGQMVLLSELTRVLARAPARSVWIGFEWELIDAGELDRLRGEAGLIDHSIEVRLVRADEHERARRAAFLRAAAEVERELDQGIETLLFISQRPGHAADAESVYPRLRGHPSLITAVVVSPTAPEPVSREVPAGYDAHVALDRCRACRGLYPAIDLLVTDSRSHGRSPAEDRHRLIARRARGCLERYQSLDAELRFPEPDSLSDPALARRARRLHAYLSQPLHVAEPFLAMPGASVPLRRTLQDVERILDGELDDVEERKLSYIASL